MTSLPRPAAARELKEETGISAQHFEAVGYLHPGYGLTNHGFHTVLATGLNQGALQRDREEQDMITRSFPLSEVFEMIRNGVLRDGPTVSALSLLQLHGKL